MYQRWVKRKEDMSHREWHTGHGRNWGTIWGKMMRRSIPFSAFWLRSSVVSVLISLVSDTRLIEPHDINLIFFGCRLIRQLAVRARERRLGMALSSWQAQPYPLGSQIIQTTFSSVVIIQKCVKKNDYTIPFAILGSRKSNQRSCVWSFCFQDVEA
jgi:hypothetical protein